MLFVAKCLLNVGIQTSSQTCLQTLQSTNEARYSVNYYCILVNCYKHMDRTTDRETDRQTDRQTDRRISQTSYMWGSRNYTAMPWVVTYTY